MYISTAALSASMRQSVLTAQVSLGQAQTELSSGTFADVGLSLGGRSGLLLSLTSQQTRIDGYSAGNAIASTRLSSTDSALTGLRTTATSFLSSLTGNAFNATSTGALAQTATDNLSGLVSTLNTTVDGQAVFGGINTASPPMTSYTGQPASATKQAVDAAFAAAFGTSQTSAAAASITAAQMTTFLQGAFAGLFSASSYGSTWSAASDQAQTTSVSASQTVTTSVSANDAAFRGLAQAYAMVTEFTGNSTLSASAQQAAVQVATNVVSDALGRLTDVQAGVGLAQNAVDGANDRLTAQKAVLSTAGGSLTAIDAYALNTKITGLQTQIEASYELTNTLKTMSLVNYLTA